MAKTNAETQGTEIIGSASNLQGGTPIRQGMVQCATHSLDIVIGIQGMMFCPVAECANSESNY